VWFRHAGLFIYGFNLAACRSNGGGVAKVLFIAQPASFVQAMRRTVIDPSAPMVLRILRHNA
jgi:hypothetical protein